MAQENFTVYGEVPNLFIYLFIYLFVYLTLFIHDKTSGLKVNNKIAFITLLRY